MDYLDILKTPDGHNIKEYMFASMYQSDHILWIDWKDAYQYIIHFLSKDYLDFVINTENGLPEDKVKFNKLKMIDAVTEIIYSLRQKSITVEDGISVCNELDDIFPTIFTDADKINIENDLKLSSYLRPCYYNDLNDDQKDFIFFMVGIYYMLILSFEYANYSKEINKGYINLVSDYYKDFPYKEEFKDNARLFISALYYYLLSSIDGINDFNSMCRNLMMNSIHGIEYAIIMRGCKKRDLIIFRTIRGLAYQRYLLFS